MTDCVLSYWLISACELLGVERDDMFELDDLLLYRNIDKGAQQGAKMYMTHCLWTHA